MRPSYTTAFASIFLVLALLALLTSVSAASFSINLATGLSANGSLQTIDQSFDPSWTTQPLPPATSPSVVPAQVVLASDVGFYHLTGPWVDDGPSSNWIVRNSSTLQQGVQGYSYTRLFTLPTGANLSSASLSGSWTVDNGGVLLLNGVQVASLDRSVSPWLTLHPFTLSSSTLASLLRSSVNNLTIVVTQVDNYYEGVRLEGAVVVDVATPPLCTVYGDLDLSSYTFVSSSGAHGSPGAVFLRFLLLPSLPSAAAAAQVVSSLQIALDANSLSLNMTLALYALATSGAPANGGTYTLLTRSLPRYLVTPSAGVYTFPVDPSLPAVYLNTSLTYAVGVYTSDNVYYAHFVVEGYNLAAASPTNPIPQSLTPTGVGVQFPMAMTVCSSAQTAAALGSPVIAGTRFISPQGGCISNGQVPNSGCVTTAAFGNLLLLFPTSLAGLTQPFYATSIVFPQGYYGSAQAPSIARLGLYRQVGGSSGAWQLLGEGSSLLQYSFNASIPYGSRLVQTATLTSPVLLNPLNDTIALAYWCGVPCYEVWYQPDSKIAGMGYTAAAPSAQTNMNSSFYQVPVSPISYSLINLWLLGNTVSPSAAPVLVSAGSSSSSAPAPTSSPCGSFISGPYAINSTQNMAPPLQVLWSDPVNSYSDVATNVSLLTGGGSLVVYDLVDSATAAWCWYKFGNCTGPQGGAVTLGSGSIPPGGWPGTTASYPINSVGYRIAPSAATRSTSLTEYAPVFNASSNVLSATITLPASFVGPQRLWFVLLDWSAADNNGTVHVMVQYTPSAQACALLAPSSSSTSALSSSSLPCTPSSAGVTVSGAGGATASGVASGQSGHYDTPTGLFVNAGDVLSFASNSTSRSWCITPTVCSNAAGISGVAGANHQQTLVVRFGNTTSDATDADWYSVFPYLSTPVTPQTAVLVVPGSVNSTSQLWLAAWDSLVTDNSGSVFVTITDNSSCRAISSSSSSSAAAPSSSATPPVFTPANVAATCVSLLTPSVSAGTTALVALTDACQLSSLTLAELEAYQAAPVCRFLPSGYTSPASLHVNSSSAGSSIVGSAVIVTCPLPLLLSAGSYMVQLSLDGGATVALPVLSAAVLAASTLTVTVQSPVTPTLSVSTQLQHPFNGAVDPFPVGFNIGDVTTFSYTATPLLPYLTLLLEVTYFAFSSTSARFAPQLVAEPILVIVSSFNTSQAASYSWTVPDLNATLLARLGVAVQQVAVLSVGGYYTARPVNASAGSIRAGAGTATTGYYDAQGLCSTQLPSVCSAMGQLGSSMQAPLAVTAYSSLASSVVSLYSTDLTHVLQSASTLQAAADVLDAASSPLAATAHTTASAATVRAANAIAVYGAQLIGGSLYASRAALAASLTAGASGTTSGASVGLSSGGSCSTLFGDVHLTTFDGVRYDFQAVGVYWLLQSVALLFPSLGVSGFAVQLHLQPLSSYIQPGAAQALAYHGVTYMAGVALQADGLCGIVQLIPRATLSPVTGTYFDVYDAGLYVNAGYVSSAASSQSSYQLSCATLYYSSRDTLTVSTYSGYTVTLTALDGIARLSTLQLCVPSSAYNSTQGGLAGSYDLNPYNDFTGQDGVDYFTRYPGNVRSTTIAAGSSGPNDAAGYAAGQTWTVQPLQSFFVSLSAPPVGCNITQDDTTAFTESCLLGGQRTANNLLVFDVNVTSILSAFNIANLPSVPLVWPNPVLQQQATVQCQAASGGQAVNSSAVQDCLLDVYYSNSTAIGVGPTQQVQAQQLVQSIAPPQLSVRTLTLTQATFAVSGLTSLTTSGGACTRLSLTPLINSSAAVQCVYIVQLATGTGSGAVFVPVNLSSTAQSIGAASASFTVSIALIPSVSYTVRVAWVVTVAASGTTAQTLFSLQSVYIPPVQSAPLCVLLYGLPGNVDYPWSEALQLLVTFNSSVVASSSGTAVAVLNGTGVRTFTNRFGVSSTTSVTVSPAATNNLLYLNSLFPVDRSGLTLNLSSPVQLPGVGPSTLFSTISLHNASSGPGEVVDGSSSIVDAGGSAYLSPIPGFTNVTIGAANLNALAPDYSACQAPISFTNGLRQPTEPNAKNGAQHLQYSYTLSDGVSYSVQCNLTLTASSAFATLQDLLGNPYQLIVNITGTRLYTYLPTRQSLLSQVSFQPSLYGNGNMTQRFYPYSLLAAAPGVYTGNSAPFLDAEGLTFSLSPAVPVNGAAVGTGTLYSSTTVHVSAYNSSQTQLNEVSFLTLPLPARQLQTVTLLA